MKVSNLSKVGMLGMFRTYYVALVPPLWAAVVAAGAAVQMSWSSPSSPVAVVSISTFGSERLFVALLLMSLCLY